MLKMKKKKGRKKQFCNFSSLCVVLLSNFLQLLSHTKNQLDTPNQKFAPKNFWCDGLLFGV
jgi:hypothetical protein